jgi:hypothetical protein
MDDYISGSNENGKVRFRLSRGSSTVTDILDMFFAMEKLYQLQGGTGKLNLTINDLQSKEVPDSEYELYPGTEFANTTTVHEHSIYPSYVPRKQVYEAIIKYSKPEKVENIKHALDKKYPKDKFGEDFPYAASIMWLFNHYLKDVNSDTFIKNK